MSDWRAVLSRIEPRRGGACPARAPGGLSRKCGGEGGKPGPCPENRAESGEASSEPAGGREGATNGRPPESRRQQRRREWQETHSAWQGRQEDREGRKHESWLLATEDQLGDERRKAMVSADPHLDMNLSARLTAEEGRQEYRERARQTADRVAATFGDGYSAVAGKLKALGLPEKVIARVQALADRGRLALARAGEKWTRAADKRMAVVAKAASAPEPPEEPSTEDSDAAWEAHEREQARWEARYGDLENREEEAASDEAEAHDAVNEVFEEHEHRMEQALADASDVLDAAVDREEKADGEPDEPDWDEPEPEQHQAAQALGGLVDDLAALTESDEEQEAYDELSSAADAVRDAHPDDAPGALRDAVAAAKRAARVYADAGKGQGANLARRSEAAVLRALKALGEDGAGPEQRTERGMAAGGRGLTAKSQGAGPQAAGPCKRGQTAARTGCTPASKRKGAGPATGGPRPSGAKPANPRPAAGKSAGKPPAAGAKPGSRKPAAGKPPARKTPPKKPPARNLSAPSAPSAPSAAPQTHRTTVPDTWLPPLPPRAVPPASERAAKVSQSFRDHIDKQAHLSAEMKRDFGAAIDRVVRSMPDKALDRLAQGVKKIDWYGSTDDLTASFKARHPDLEDGYVIKGSYQGKLKRLHLNGETFRLSTSDLPAELNVHGTYAHELTHALDPDDKLAGSDDWQQAFQEEIEALGPKGPKLSNYARSNRFEGFAEFGRLVYGSDVPHETIEKRFPKCAAFFRSQGLWKSS